MHALIIILQFTIEKALRTSSMSEDLEATETSVTVPYWRILTLNSFCTVLAAFSLYYYDLGPIFSRVRVKVRVRRKYG